MDQLPQPNHAPEPPLIQNRTRAYLSGFGNALESEALAGALPLGRNSPQRCAYGLYAEQLSGTAFTAPRASNKRSWLYRIRPSVRHWGDFRKADIGFWRTAPCREVDMPVSPLRWDPIPVGEESLSFIEGIRTVSTAGDASLQCGVAAHVYVATRSMGLDYFYNADGEMLIVPQQGALSLRTEFGVIDVTPGEIAVVPRGVKFAVDIVESLARGYVCENYGSPLTLPERGPIGANCLANSRDFLAPSAAYETLDGPCNLFVKWDGGLWVAELDHAPLDVVAWHGNYVPYKYDLRRFSPVGPVLFDHADPSIFTVLTSASDTPGTPNMDFVIFPDRWVVTENTFRPPWYHMNVMSEFMGLIYGVYDAKPGGGFAPGGFSLHNSMLPHGPDAEAFIAASAAALEPVKLQGTMAFMFETRHIQRVTAYAAALPERQANYMACWRNLAAHFDPKRP